MVSGWLPGLPTATKSSKACSGSKLSARTDHSLVLVANRVGCQAHTGCLEQDILHSQTAVEQGVIESMVLGGAVRAGDHGDQHRRLGRPRRAPGDQVVVDLLPARSIQQHDEVPRLAVVRAGCAARGLEELEDLVPGEGVGGEAAAARSVSQQGMDV